MYIGVYSGLSRYDEACMFLREECFVRCKSFNLEDVNDKCKLIVTLSTFIYHPSPPFLPLSDSKCSASIELELL